MIWHSSDLEHLPLSVSLQYLPSSDWALGVDLWDEAGLSAAGAEIKQSVSINLNGTKIYFTAR